jgi:hypothetical protein
MLRVFGRSSQNFSPQLGPTYARHLSPFSMHIYNCQTSPVLTSKISSPAHSISSILASYNDVQLPMAVPSPRKKKLSAAAAAVLLLVILTAGTVTSHISSSLESLEQLILVCSCMSGYVDQCRVNGRFLGWLQRAPERRLQRSLLAMDQGRRVRQGVHRRELGQHFRHLPHLSMLLLDRMRRRCHQGSCSCGYHSNPAMTHASAFLKGLFASVGFNPTGIINVRRKL